MAVHDYTPNARAGISLPAPCVASHYCMSVSSTSRDVIVSDEAEQGLLAFSGRAFSSRNQ
ncbi:hypothetical protein D187_002700 [Cystobacter fuscus DSM 2262]|uniref:Uncharacterized protein n=1 Tax=Cystobacter fuscus (strain ATCC 25194 / DSM 2262 / NBRC 100088 / M29) TaxID=1242864 RepID=S9P9Z6_CYSF2|nr:hypothetical protein D187_002700 [Cystobacter fuscus DSM 2262]